MSTRGPYEARSFRIDHETPRARNLVLYIGIVGLVKLLEQWFQTPAAVGLTLLSYGFVFDLINPDFFSFDKNGHFQEKVSSRKLFTQPTSQPFKDVINMVRKKSIGR